MRKTVFTLFLVAGALLACATAEAQQYRTSPWIFNFGGGGSIPVGAITSTVNAGWNLQFGATYKPVGKNFGLQLDFDYHGLGITDEALKGWGSNDGYGQLWVFGLNGMFEPAKRSGQTFGYYLLGGGGAQLRRAVIHEGTGYSPGWCDPWWGWCYPPGWVPVYGAHSEWSVGADVGIGLTLNASPNTQLYLESRYNHVFKSGDDGELIPITFGIRW